MKKAINITIQMLPLRHNVELLTKHVIALVQTVTSLSHSHILPLRHKSNGCFVG